MVVQRLGSPAIGNIIAGGGGSRVCGEGQQVTVHAGGFHPGISLFYREPEPMASQVSVLIPDERIGGRVGALVSWCPGPWSGFPVASRSQPQLGWAESVCFMGWEPPSPSWALFSTCPACTFLPSPGWSYSCSHPPAVCWYLHFLTPQGSLASLGSSHHLRHKVGSEEVGNPWGITSLGPSAVPYFALIVSGAV